MQNFYLVKPRFSKSLFFRALMLFLLVFASTNLVAQTSVAPQYATWGCQVGNNIYWDWLGTSYTSGGTVYYRFNSSGRYTPWDNDYALRDEYRCDRFINGSPAGYSCSVNGTVGVRGYIQTSTTYCPLDSNMVFLGMGLILFLTYLYRRRSFHMAPSGY